jgi:hypothetical protein
MKPIRIILWTRPLACALLLSLALLAADSGAELFQKAVTQEQAAGNLEEAIKLYQQVAKEYASNRALAAKALIQAARCYEKLGEDKATKLYEQVARDFSDQTDSANTARVRLVALRRQAAPVTMMQRKIEPPNGEPAFFYTDGQRAVWQDAAANALMIGDLNGRNKRVIFKCKPGESFASQPAFMPSRDLSMVWLRLVAAGGRVTNGVIRIDGTGYRELFQGYPFVDESLPDWSWDNRYLLFHGALPAAGAIAVTQSDPIAVGSGVVVVSVSDGKSREVVRRDRSVWRAVFSPDGRFIAFSEVGSGGPFVQKTYVTPFQGGEPWLVSDDANLLDWTPDGRYLAVSSQSSGSMALYLLPVRDGQPSGNAVFVRYGSFVVAYTNPNGSLVYYSPPAGGAKAILAALDSNSRLGAWRPLDLSIKGNTFIGGMNWSADSAQIAYRSTHEDSGQPGSVVRVRSIASGEDREAYRSSADFVDCQWEVKRPNLFCVESNNAGPEALSVAVDSGHAERLGSLPEFSRAAVEDFARMRGIELVSMDKVYQFSEARARVVNRSVEIRSTPGGEWKHLVAVNDPGTVAVTYSRHGVFYLDKDSSGKGGLYRVSPEGGQPERLGETPAELAGSLGLVMIDVSSDGRNILLESFADPGLETWQLQNFEPKQAGTRRANP